MALTLLENITQSAPEKASALAEGQRVVF
jgi:hypothetical protein